jgi:hypothetical protein
MPNVSEEDGFLKRNDLLGFLKEEDCRQNFGIAHWLMAG